MQRDRRFRENCPAQVVGDRRHSNAAIARCFARPKRLPLVTIRRRKERFRSRAESLLLSKIYDQEPFFSRLLAEVAETECAPAEHRAINAARLQFTETSIGLA